MLYTLVLVVLPACFVTPYRCIAVVQLLVYVLILKFSMIIFRVYLKQFKTSPKMGSILTGVKIKTEDYKITSSTNENEAGVTHESKSNFKRIAKGI
jgi:hypothetical protein